LSFAKPEKLDDGAAPTREPLKTRVSRVTMSFDQRRRAARETMRKKSLAGAASVQQGRVAVLAAPATPKNLTLDGAVLSPLHCCGWRDPSLRSSRRSARMVEHALRRGHPSR
jgi:hypothetical protein